MEPLGNKAYIGGHGCFVLAGYQRMPVSVTPFSFKENIGRHLPGCTCGKVHRRSFLMPRGSKYPNTMELSTKKMIHLMMCKPSMTLYTQTNRIMVVLVVCSM